MLTSSRQQNPPHSEGQWYASTRLKHDTRSPPDLQEIEEQNCTIIYASAWSQTDGEISHRPRTRDPRRPLHAHQEGTYPISTLTHTNGMSSSDTAMFCLGRRRPQAPRAQPQGQGQQVPPHSHRIPHPPPLAILQVRRCAATDLEIRERDGQHAGGVSYLLWGGKDGIFEAWRIGHPHLQPNVGCRNR